MRVKTFHKKDFPLDEVRRHLEPGPIVLLSTAWKGKTNIMTLGWHMMLGFSPALVGCYVWDQDHSFQMLRKSKQCVINVPTVDLIKTVVAIGNCHGDAIDKFSAFGLTPQTASKVAAPLIKECYANFECRLADTRLIPRYRVFIWEVVKAHVAVSPKKPKTLHYRGHGEFMIAGAAMNMRKQFKPENL